MDAYTRYSSALIRKARRILQNEDDAFDVIQSLFTDLLQSENANFELPYLYRATTNRCLTMIRDRNNRNRLLELQAPALRGMVRTRCDEETIGLDLLTKLSERLDERSMEILVARFYDDMKQEEIAKSLNTSRKTCGAGSSTDSTNSCRTHVGRGGGIMNTAQCISEPVSWLRLERHHLGELADTESSEINVHLKGCDACRSYANEVGIVEYDASSIAEKPNRARFFTSAIAATTAIAAAFLLIPRSSIEGVLPPSQLGIKGGDVVLTLLRERSGDVVENPEVYAARDRFKVLFTCPPNLEEPRDVLVFQDGEMSLPLRSNDAPGCGNRVPWPGAFTITGSSAATVCVVWGDTAARVQKGVLSPTKATDLSDENTVCRRLDGMK